ncbi:HAD-IIB family hydrolase [Mycoplasma enhydrae]|uniref:HAD-IIB family hydrolase n=1 Tax=Mycoplasma enhydrae TaxID=2499220 RepID=UPI0021E8AF4E|nr:HAD-IIB family hydrolase [Mycoplasma enhydrae]MCV3753726.1 HAD-IIB family hydrolase [Mycoplasma enhydrae]
MYKLTNNKKPVIYSDVDGTIYRNFNLLEETCKDINFAIENGADFNICTGNPVQERMLKLASKINARYLICSSGAEIYDVQNQKIIKTWTIDFSILDELIKIASKNQFQMIFWDENNYFYLKELPEFNQEIFQYHFISQDNIKKIPQKWNGQKINPIKIEIYSIDYPLSTTYPQKMYEYIKHIDNIEAIVTYCNIEINAKDINKGSAVRWMTENVYKNDEVKLDEVMTIGDSNNDLPMLKLTNYSYAMANSTKLPLQTAKLFTSDVVQNGLGEAILDYLYRLKNIARKHMFHDFLKGGK